MSGFYPPKPSVAAITPSLAVDVPCRKCQYNLRGLAGDSACPECGAPVALSTRGDLIRYSDPAWIERLASGLPLLIYGIAISVFLGMTVYIVTKVNPDWSAPPWLLRLLRFTAAMVVLEGTWRATTPDPAGLGESEYGLLRKTTRAAVLATLLHQIWLAIGIQDGLPPELKLSAKLVNALLAAMFAIGCFTFMGFIARLSMRIRDQGLSQSARTLMLPFCVPILILQMIFTAQSFDDPVARPSMATLYFIGLAGIILFVAGAIFLILLERIDRRLAEQLELAKPLWGVGK